MSFADVPSTKLDTLRRVYDLIATKESNRDLSPAVRNQIFEEVNKLLPLISINVPFRGKCVHDIITAKSKPPMSTLIVMLDCGLDLSVTEVVHKVLSAFEYQDDQIRLLTDHGADRVLIVESLIRPTQSGSKSEAFGSLYEVLTLANDYQKIAIKEKLRDILLKSTGSLMANGNKIY